MNIPKVLQTIFFIEPLWWLLLISVLIFRKKIKEKKVSAEIAFALISLFHVQIQKPAHRSTTLRAFISLAKFTEFYYHKNLKQEVHDDLRVCVDERSPCGLTTIGDIKIYQCHMIKT